MPRLPRWTALALITLGLALPSLAQDASVARRPGRHHFRACLSILGLNDAQKAAISGILEASRPALEAEAAAVHAAHEVLREALEAQPPDACDIGEKSLGVQAAVEALRQERESVRSQIVATLEPEQQSRFEGCLDSPRPQPQPADRGEPAD